MAVSAQLVKELRERTQAGMMDCKKALDATNGDIEAAILWLRENGLSKAAKKADRVAAEGVTRAAKDASSALIMEVNAETDFVAQNKEFMDLVDNIADALLAENTASVEEAKNIKMKTGETVQEAITAATAKIGEKIDLRRLTMHEIKDGETVAIYNHANNRVSVMLVFTGDINDEDAYNVAMHVAAMSPQYMTEAQVPQEFKDQEMKIIKENTDLTGKPDQIKDRILQGKLQKRLGEVTLMDQAFVVDENFKVGEFIKSKHAELKEMVRYEVGEGIEKIESDFAAEVAAQAKGTNK